MARAFLAGQSRLAVSGAEAADFLQGLVTTDIEALKPGVAAPGALLTPQGKIMFFFLISRQDGGYEIEIAGDQAEAFARRLMMYRLRAKVEIGAPKTEGTTVVWDEGAPSGAVLDHRFALAGIDLYRLAGRAGDAEGYDALRAQAGVPEPGADFALSDVFPHDILMDRSGGVSFKKGCYVGQEVVSRMQHRSTARRRLVSVSAETKLPESGTELKADGKVLGTLGTVAGSTGLAIVRIDRAGAAMQAGTEVKADDVTVGLTLPAWSGLSFPTSESED